MIANDYASVSPIALPLCATSSSLYIFICVDVSAHQYHVRVENSASTLPVKSYGKIELTLIGSADINETLSLTQ